ncbi:TolC family protein, partial [Bradyrhizobium ottawaense]|uniref:TolC family protein n=1 Tax=Bradyrhizobium ottawaense TaxID=931866 RepID=UPI0030C6BAFD
RFLPATIAAAVNLGLVDNPSVTAAMYGIDVNYLQVKINEGALLPTVTVQAGITQQFQQTLTVFRTTTASAIATASVPI